MLGYRSKARATQAEREYRLRVRKNKAKAAYIARRDRERAVRADNRAREQKEIEELQHYWATLEAEERRQRIENGRGKRYWAEVQATPRWADPKAMLLTYAYAKLLTIMTGVRHHVDHVVPIVSDTVCGLHCHQNMRAVPASENCSKGNRWWPGMNEWC